jgi:gliding motility-associated-like protein
MKTILSILLFAPLWLFAQNVQTIKVCTEDQSYLQDYWVADGPNIYDWVVEGGTIEIGQGTSQITVNWLNVPYDMYQISVSIISDDGCIGDTSHLLVDIDECSFDGVYVPNCVTVNGDGVNDVWGPVFSGEWDDTKYKMYIFNRWGGLIWESYHPLETWDGKHKGKLCQDGVYIWLMYCKPVNGFQSETHGHVTLLK